MISLAGPCGIRQACQEWSGDGKAGNARSGKVNWGGVDSRICEITRGSTVIRPRGYYEKERFVVQVAITCKHGQLGANQQEYIKRKSEKLLTYFERVTAINVTVTFENGGVRVEILVDAEHKHNFVANDSGDDVTPTFDVTLHKMEQQIKKYKERIQDHRRDLPVKGAEEEDD